MLGRMDRRWGRREEEEKEEEEDMQMEQNFGGVGGLRMQLMMVLS
jgi:hypothetical protein